MDVIKGAKNINDRNCKNEKYSNVLKEENSSWEKSYDNIEHQGREFKTDIGVNEEGKTNNKTEAVFKM